MQKKIQKENKYTFGKTQEVKKIMKKYRKNETKTKQKRNTFEKSKERKTLERTLESKNKFP